jgi:hypothetical protein
VKVFVKGDPTSITKPGRIIFSKSLVDALVARLLIFDSMSKDIENWKTGHSTVGIDLTNPELLGEFYRNVFKSGKPVISDDLSSFDWCYDDWCYFLYLNIMLYRHLGCFSWEARKVKSNQQWFFKLFHATVKLDLQCLVVLSDGTLFMSLETMMLSGAAWTAQGDTEVRTALAKLVYYDDPGFWSDMAKSNGDDCIEPYNHDEVSNDTFHEIRNLYARYGFKVTDQYVAYFGEDLHFCSQIINEFTSYPESWEKAVYNLLDRSEVSSNTWDDFYFVYHRRPDFEEKARFLLDVLGREIHIPK